MLAAALAITLSQPICADGAWCWFSDPRAIQVNGTTYAGWVTRDGTIQVGAWRGRDEVQVATLHEKLERDDHANPSLLALPNGEVLAFYSKHADNTTRMRRLVDDAWQPEQQLKLMGGSGEPVCYTNPAYLADEDRIYLTWRGREWKPTLSWSDDHGKTWTEGRLMFKTPGTDRGVRPYLKATGNGRDKMHFLITDGHPRNERFNSVYYCYLKGGEFFRADGSKIGSLHSIPIAHDQMDLVYDARAESSRAWVWDVAESEDGHPVAAYTRLPAENRHEYRYARWNGERWVDRPIVSGGKWFPQTPEGQREVEPHYSGGLVLDHETPNVVYLSRPVNGTFEVERWETGNGGDTWASLPLSRNSDAPQVRPVAVRGAERGDVQVLWMSGSYITYQNYATTIVGSRQTEHQPLTAFRPSVIRTVMRQAGQWQIDNPSSHQRWDWTQAPFYTGLYALHQTDPSGDWLAELETLGKATDWSLGPRPYMADDHAVGQAWIQASLALNKPAYRTKTITGLRDFVAQPHNESLLWVNSIHDREWAWCDSLFMGPPALALAHKATDNDAYLSKLDRLWWKTKDYLYDEEEHLYFRDSRYFEPREKNGEKVFWSRGNGWVYGGLARVLDFTPEDWVARPRFEAHFKEMSARLIELQQPDGYWRSSLLDPASYPAPETSGTGFFTYGLAWGINHGLLDEATYLPHVKKGWEALARQVDANGRLGHVQQVGQDPRSVQPTDTEVYGVGAFLLAGSEVIQLAGK